MSLLFDALKRAQETDTGVEQGDSQFIDLSEPEAAIGMEQADSQSANLSVPEAAIPPVAGPPGANPAPEVGVMAAQSIFAATARQSRRIVSLTVGGLVILLLAGGGGFWYYQRTMTSLVSQPAIAIPPPAETTVDLTAPPQLPAEEQAPATPNLASNGDSSAESASVHQDLSSSPVNSAAQETAIAAAAAGDKGTDVYRQQASPEKLVPAPSLAGKATASLVPLIEKSGSGEGSAAKKVQPKSLTPRQKPSREQPDKGDAQPQPVADNSVASHIRLSASTDPLREGYQALTEGRLDDAERHYLEVIAKRPHERDALLGLAVIAHRKLQKDRASDLYRQVLREDPGNPTATAALVNLSVQVDPVAAESRLKQLLDQKPTSPELHHALGSVLARQKRWGEAQQAFFRAFSLEPGNALFAYNLAVALDRLHKPSEALPYYEKSAQTLKPGDAALNRDTIEQRVQELRSAMQVDGL